MIVKVRAKQILFYDENSGKLIPRETDSEKVVLQLDDNEFVIIKKKYFEGLVE